MSSVSVILCTFNGERFLQDQLAGFVAQTRLPDEDLGDVGSSKFPLRPAVPFLIYDLLCGLKLRKVEQQ